MSNSPTTPVPENDLYEALLTAWLDHDIEDTLYKGQYRYTIICKCGHAIDYDNATEWKADTIGRHVVDKMIGAVESYGDRRELEGLRRLEDQSDCIEDSCGLDADLLVHNLLARIRELEKSDEPSITPNMKEAEL